MWRWIQDHLGEGALVRDRKADNNRRFLDRSRGGFLRACDHEIADAAALNFGGAFDDGEVLGRDARLDAGGAGRYSGDQASAILWITEGNGPDRASIFHFGCCVPRKVRAICDSAFDHILWRPPRLRVTFDSNAWEKVFDPLDAECAIIRDALASGRIEGFICEAAFRIEAVTKKDRDSYFGQPHFGSRFEGIVERDGRPYLQISFGPEDDLHPGVPAVQTAKLQEALRSGVRLMRGLAWMGLPAPLELRDPTIFVLESRDAAAKRAQRQIGVFAAIESRGVGKAAFDAAGGWSLSSGGQINQKKFRKVCAEWADGELACAHVGYQNDILCTNDHGRNAGTSIFDPENRAWLTASFGVAFRTLAELVAEVAQ